MTKERAIEMINDWIKADKKIILRNYRKHDVVAYYREAVECYEYVLKVLKGEKDNAENNLCTDK